MQYIFCSAYISRSLHRVTSSAACNEIYSLVLLMRVTFALICVMNCFPLGGYFCIDGVFLHWFCHCTTMTKHLQYQYLTNCFWPPLYH